MLTETHSQPPLAAGVLDHLEAQIASAGRLLGQVLGQGAAIRARDVDGVLVKLTEMKAEMARRAALETERSRLLRRAGAALGTAPEGVTLDAMASLMPAAEATRALALSSELRGLLGEIAREHGINRALMRQELSFLDHLVRLLGNEPEGGYNPTGGEQRGYSHRVLDVQA